MPGFLSYTVYDKRLYNHAEYLIRHRFSLVLFAFYETACNTAPGSNILEEVEIIIFISAGPLEAFGQVAWQLLQDVQERLVFRAHCYLESDILQYKPAAGDLAYPEKLELMEV